MVLLAHLSSQPTRHLDWFSHFCTADGTVSLYFTTGRTFSTQEIAPSHGDLGPNLIHDSLGPFKPTTQTASQLVQPFLHSYRSPQSVPILYNGPPLPPQNCPFPWGDLNPFNTWFLEPNQAHDHNPNDISIGSLIFAGLTTVTDHNVIILL